jgi:hypothetical protein
MEELALLKQYIRDRDYDHALLLIDEMEAMSKEDKFNKIYSFAVIVLVHLIKQAAEQRSTRSWEFSIYNAIKSIKRVNKRPKSGGYYATESELREILLDAFDTAIKRAALEAFEGQYSELELMAKIDADQIREQAMLLIQAD